ncbi:MAG: fused MFS/spermidine synthase [Gemmatimonadota bacterium]
MHRRPLHLPWLVLLFVGSGAAALMYEVIWFQLLQLVIGSSAVSLGVLLGTFMGGMCAGSLMLPRIVDRRHHPLLVYAVLEAAIAVCGLCLVWTMPFIGEAYAVLGGGHVSVRIAIAGICLLPPTMAMGATLPAVARWVEASPSGISWLGRFYAGNLAGAVLGTLLTGFYLLRVFDVTIATYSAAALNLAVAIAAWTIARRASTAPTAVAPASGSVATPPSAIHLVIALSGLTALSAQVVWTRLLSLVFGATVYTFSLILAAFLIGLGAGSALSAAVLRRASVRPHVALGWCQMLLCGAIAWAAYLVTNILPFWPIAEAVANSPWRTFEHDLFCSLLVVCPAALLWGASLPLAMAAAATEERDSAEVVGGVYAANTAGAIVGALVTSLLLSWTIGSQHTQQLLIGIAAAAGMLALSWSPEVPVIGGEHSSKGAKPAPARPGRRSGTADGSVRPALWIGLALSLIVLVPTVSPVPGALIAYGRGAADWAETIKVADAGRIVYAGEGVSEFVAVSQGAAGEMYFHAAGKVQASTQPQDLRLQLLLAHLSHLVPAHPANALVIGCGAGITAGALGLGPGVGHITIADIEPLVPRVAAAYFGDVNHHIIQDPRVSLRLDDGRHVLATTNQMFDVITTDLIDPWVKGVAALFTREFFELAKRHLRPGGVVTQFVQLYQSSPEAVKSEIGTFVEAFPNAIVWGNPHEGQGYDLVLLGQVKPTHIDVDALTERLERPEYAPVRDSLRTIGIESAMDLVATYAAAGSDLRGWLQDAAISRDRNMRLQYLAGLGLNQDENGPIYQDILKRSTFPAATFVGAPATLETLRRRIEDSRRP